MLFRSTILNQICHQPSPGTIKLRRISLNNILEFSISGLDETVSIAETTPYWVHYAFTNDGYQRRLLTYRNEYIHSSIKGQMIAFPSCDITVGDFSSAKAFMGTFKDFRIWNETKSSAEILKWMHLIPYSESTLEFYLPIDEGYGTTIVERKRNNKVKMTVLKSSSRTWISKGDLKICKPPYVYGSGSNVCLCKLSCLI